MFNFPDIESLESAIAWQLRIVVVIVHVMLWLVDLAIGYPSADHICSKPGQTFEKIVLLHGASVVATPVNSPQYTALHQPRSWTRSHNCNESSNFNSYQPK
jgi:hypothetical protein